MKELVEKDEIIVSEILAGAKQLFTKYGLKKTTMEEIAQAVGKGKSTLYYYFPSKNEIFEGVVEQEMKNLIKRLRTAINAADTAVDQLKAFSNTQLLKICEYQNLSSVLNEEIFEKLQQISHVKQRYQQRQIDMVKEILTGGVESGEFKNLSAEKIDKLSFLLVISFRGFEFPIAIKPNDLQTEHYMDVMIDTLVEGIGRN